MYRDNANHLVTTFIRVQTILTSVRHFEDPLRKVLEGREEELQFRQIEDEICVSNQTL